MKILFVSLGCDKNLVDTEEMLGLLSDNGYSFTNDEAEADVVVINTCCFIHDAKEESVEAILEMAELKKTSKCKSLIVAGCLASRYEDEIMALIPEVDAIIGTTAIDKIVEAIKETTATHRNEKHLSILDPDERIPLIESKRISTNGGWYSYLKIAEGCDRNCTYCIIPKVRGPFRSLPKDFILKRAKELASAGASELILVAQDLTLYGRDNSEDKDALPNLIREIAKIDEVKWIRLLYCYPEDISDELIAVIKDEVKVCHYIDMPVQHSSNPILKKMGRRTSQEEINEKISKLREAVADICIRTTLITGFPGETEEDFKNVLDFVKKTRFDRLGVFTYSLEEGTPAEKLPNHLPEEIKEKRKDAIMKLQQEISYELSNDMIGKIIEVVIDGYIPEEDVYVARSYRDAPDVDGTVFISLKLEDSRDIYSGTYVKVLVTAATEYDLIAEFV